jgi:CHAT domain-containing protein
MSQDRAERMVGVVRVIAGIVLSCLLVAAFGSGITTSHAANQDTIQHANELLQLSNEQNRSDHLLALTTAQSALNAFQLVNDKGGIARAYSQIGRCHLAMNQLTEATSNLQNALQRWRELNDVSEQAETLIMLAFVEHRKGEWNNTLAFYNQAQSLGRVSSYQLGQIANGMGYLFNETGLLDSALEQFQQSLAHYKQSDDKDAPLAVNRVLMDIGYTKLLLGDYEESVNYLQQALPNFDPTQVDAAECHENLGRVYFALANYPQALEHLKTALPIYERAKNAIEIDRVNALIGQIYEQQGSLALARPQYARALSTFRRLGDRMNEAAVTFLLGRLELKAGHLDVAETYLKQSIEATEELRSVSLGREVTAAYSASVHDRYEAYIACLLRRSKLESSPVLSQRAFEASELSRARSLAELLRDTQTNLLAGVDPRLSEREKTLRQKIKVKIDERLALLEAGGDQRKQFNEVEATLQQLRAEHQQVNEELRSVSPAYAQVTQPTAYSLQQIQLEVLEDDQTTLLEYVLTDETSYVWVVTRNQIKVTELSDKAAITAAVQKLYNSVSIRPKQGDDTAITKATEELSAMVLKPVADQLTGSRLIVVADGALNYIPFQMLSLPSQPEPLIATHEIVNTPSASILGQLRQEKQQRGTPENVVAAFGYPAFASNYAELKGAASGELMAEVRKNAADPWTSAMRDIELTGDDVDVATIKPLVYSREELAQLREVAGPGSFFATGFAASRETLEHTNLSKFAILHFATHGALNPKKPEKSGFLLSTVGPEGQRLNGFITINDVYQLRAPVELVVLSACRTGLGKDIRGEGLNSVTRGFMYAGASSIAASLWNVDDDVTADLMKHFYANMLQQGMPPAAALRAAQNTIRRQPAWRSPFYWAAFTLQGEYKQPIRVLPSRNDTRLTQKIVVVVLVLLLLSGFGWWYWQRRRRRTAL